MASEFRVLERAVRHLPDEWAIEREHHSAEDEANDDPCPYIVLLMRFDFLGLGLHDAQTGEGCDSSRSILPQRDVPLEGVSASLSRSWLD